MSSIFSDLVKELTTSNQAIIQTHNFPDHDAVCSAFALQQLLAHKNIDTVIIYDGEIQRDSLKQTIDELGIDIFHHDDINLGNEHKIVVIDGCKGNQNVRELIGEEIAVIDHHQVTQPENVPFADIRSHYGATASIITEYFIEADIVPSRDVATALLIAINMDTALLTRGVHSADLEAYQYLYGLADVPQTNSILRNFIQTKDLDFYREALNRIIVSNRYAYCHFPDGCHQNLMGVLADFFLSLKEVDFVVLCAMNDEVINFSIRSERPEWDASKIIQQVLDGKGFGGGHNDMAGGIIKDSSVFDNDEIYHAFAAEIGI